MSNKTIKTTLAAGIAAAAFAFPAVASAYSHTINQSKTYEVIPGASFLNAGFTVGGKNVETSSSTSARAQATQTNSVWAKLDGKKYTISSLTGDAYGNTAWTKGTKNKYSSYAKLSATLFGQSVLSTGGSCAATECIKTKSSSVTKNITPDVMLFGVSFWGVDFGVKGKLTGTMGYKFDARGYADDMGLAGVQLDGMAENGGNGSVNLVVSVGLNAGIVSGNVSANVDIVKASAGAEVANRLKYYSQTNMDLGWVNKAPLKISSAGGKVVAKACYDVWLSDGCADKTLYTWKGFSTSTTLYSNTGSLNDQTAF